jgi:hypothetical protein
LIQTSPTHSFIYSLTHSLTHTLTHTRTHTHTHTHTRARAHTRRVEQEVGTGANARIWSTELRDSEAGMSHSEVLLRRMDDAYQDVYQAYADHDLWH